MLAQLVELRKPVTQDTTSEHDEFVKPSTSEKLVKRTKQANPDKVNIQDTIIKPCKSGKHGKPDTLPMYRNPIKLTKQDNLANPVNQ